MTRFRRCIIAGSWKRCLKAFPAYRFEVCCKSHDNIKWLFQPKLYEYFHDNNILIRVLRYIAEEDALYEQMNKLVDKVIISS